MHQTVQLSVFNMSPSLVFLWREYIERLTFIYSVLCTVTLILLQPHLHGERFSHHLGEMHNSIPALHKIPTDLPHGPK